MIKAMFPRRALSLILTATAAFGLAACSSQEPEQLQVEVLETKPFDDTAFTQGLEVVGDDLLVSTGQYGQSGIFYRTSENPRANYQALEPQYFGEGSTRSGDVVWELTWKAGVAFKRDATTLQEIGRVEYEGEGWGLCSFDDAIVMSDGTDTLRILDPATFAEQRRVKVDGLEGRSAKLNELACVDGKVYANVFLSTDIYRIDLKKAKLDAIIDASTVENRAVPNPNHVLNGIANIPGTDEFWITGKRWPDIYRVRFH